MSNQTKKPAEPGRTIDRGNLLLGPRCGGHAHFRGAGVTFALTPAAPEASPTAKPLVRKY